MDHSLMLREYEEATHYAILAIQTYRSSGLTDDKILDNVTAIIKHLPDPDIVWARQRAMAIKRGVAWIRIHWGPYSVIRYFGPFWFRFANKFRRIKKPWGGL